MRYKRLYFDIESGEPFPEWEEVYVPILPVIKEGKPIGRIVVLGTGGTVEKGDQSFKEMWENEKT